MKLSKIVFPILLVFFVLVGNLWAEPTTKDDIKIILEQMDKRFDQVDRRFEQVDNRFEQVDKRLDQMLWLLALWIPIAFGIVLYILQRIHNSEDRLFSLTQAGYPFKNDPVALIHTLEMADAQQKKRIKELLKG